MIWSAVGGHSYPAVGDTPSLHPGFTPGMSPLARRCPPLTRNVPRKRLYLRGALSCGTLRRKDPSVACGGDETERGPDGPLFVSSPPQAMEGSLRRKVPQERAPLRCKRFRGTFLVRGGHSCQGGTPPGQGGHTWCKPGMQGRCVLPPRVGVSSHRGEKCPSPTNQHHKVLAMPRISASGPPRSRSRSR